VIVGAKRGPDGRAATWIIHDPARQPFVELPVADVLDAAWCFEAGERDGPRLRAIGVADAGVERILADSLQSLSRTSRADEFSRYVNSNDADIDFDIHLWRGSQLRARFQKAGPRAAGRFDRHRFWCVAGR